MQQLDRESWNRFVTDNHGSFLQSWQWAEFQERVGRHVFRFAQEEWVIQFVEMPLPLGLKYWYGGRGPTTKLKSKNEKVKIIEGLEKISILPEVVFLRLDPAWPPGTESIFLEHGWSRTHDIQPRRNWVLDITKPETELLAAMHPKARYNIRLAEKNGALAVRRGEPAEDFEVFWRLMTETARRQQIRLHPRTYYEAMLAMPMTEFWLAEYKGEPIAGHIVVFFGSRATYLHGGSSYEHRSLMAPYLLHWRTIEEAKRRGLAEYDFGGVDEVRWSGLTRFKQGFGGRGEKYAGTFDLPLKPAWYKLYRLARSLTR